MAGGYTRLTSPHPPPRDNTSQGEGVQGDLQPLQTVDNDLISRPADLPSPDLTVASADPSCPAPPRDLISVFVVTFDPKEGNLLEWSVPKGVALDGIEFRALISGAHTVTSDFIYFRQGDFYGAACYEKLEILSESERGVRMKSVGVIVAHYCSLYPHLPLLAKLVRRVLHQPGDYSPLEEYFSARRAPTPPPTNWHAPPRVTNGASPGPATPSSPSIHQVIWARTKDDRDDEGPVHLLQCLGEQVVALWRASLLCKRILLLSEPPIGRVCFWVHWVTLLGAHTTPGLPSALLRPLYYISLSDLDLLAEQHAYVACTTEKIFEEKTGIYDLYVEGGGVRSVKKLPAVTTVTPEDRRRLSALMNRGRISRADFRAFFQELNDGIFSALYRACGIGGTGVIGSEELVAMGLNAHDDRVFVRELAATHGFDVTVSGGGCACCRCVT